MGVSRSCSSGRAYEKNRCRFAEVDACTVSAFPMQAMVQKVDIEKIWPALEHVDSRQRRSGFGREQGGGCIDTYDRAMDAAVRLNNIDDVTERIRQLVEASDNASRQFVRQALQGRMRAYRTGNSTVA